ncbi:hypothetical protein DFO61_0393 [Ectopseudomonas oleovorans]|uniref:Uncharacterized protein n=1 Tax=Ectopseudomonas oleovorans TaxID=301 RepID=A0A397NK35_ECTOL|nr:hypothetical protein DFO61_0393 [Pseudomonas oleovorans]
MLNQFVNSVWNAGSLAQDNTACSADILFNEVEDAPDVNSHYLENFIGNPNGAVAVPVFNHYLRYGHLSNPLMIELTP